MIRFLDFLFSLLGLVLLSPLFISIGIAIKLTSNGPVLFNQLRVGLNGLDFNVLKFRTMRTNSDKLSLLTVGDRDPRITALGYFLRKYKLDEFPQFINVFIGQMSIVGPRPEVKEYVDLYNEEQKKVLNVKPGITDYASLEYFDENELLGKSENPQETYIKEIMPAKLELNKKYLSNPTISHDISIMWKTFMKMIK